MVQRPGRAWTSKLRTKSKSLEREGCAAKPELALLREQEPKNKIRITCIRVEIGGRRCQEVSLCGFKTTVWYAGTLYTYLQTIRFDLTTTTVQQFHLFQNKAVWKGLAADGTITSERATTMVLYDVLPASGYYGHKQRDQTCSKDRFYAKKI